MDVVGTVAGQDMVVVCREGQDIAVEEDMVAGADMEEEVTGAEVDMAEVVEVNLKLEMLFWMCCRDMKDKAVMEVAADEYFFYDCPCVLCVTCFDR